MTTSIAYGSYQIHCNIEGEGEPLLFLHGWPANSALWNAQVAVFKNSHRCIRIDWLGFGHSDRPSDFAYSFTAMQEMLDAVLPKLIEADEKVNIVAQDVGGPPAILWAAANPNRVQRLILLNTIIYPMSTPLHKVSHFGFRIPLLNRLVTWRFGLSVIMQIMTAHWGTAIRSRISGILDNRQAIKHEVCLKTILEPLDLGQEIIPQLEQKIQQLSADKFLVIAKKDPLCYAHMKKLHERLPELPAYHLNSCGHLLAIDEPEALNGVLRKILGE